MRSTAGNSWSRQTDADRGAAPGSSEYLATLRIRNCLSEHLEFTLYRTRLHGNPSPLLVVAPTRKVRPATWVPEKLYGRERGLTSGVGNPR